MRVYLDILYCPMHAWNKISVCVCLSTALRSWGSVSSSSSRLALHIHHEQIYLWYDSGMKIATHFSGLLKLSRSKNGLIVRASPFRVKCTQKLLGSVRHSGAASQMDVIESTIRYTQPCYLGHLWKKFLQSSSGSPFLLGALNHSWDRDMHSCYMVISGYDEPLD